ncbi:MAG: tRNA lysidine(34) synthetase TilS, partial [Bdellovibrionales bacterium]|nr:tRNA lysidine(34) synthetase TilS [Bdellovibrionales bacterium]
MTVKYSIKQYQVKKFISDSTFLSLRGASYFQKIARFLIKFMDDFCLIPDSKNIWIGVSGGQDSMALLTCCVLLKRYEVLKNIKVIHIDHGSRSDGYKDYELIKEVCDKFGVNCYLKQTKVDFSMPDYENFARKNRYEIFNKILPKGDLLYTAHNINDSYEWSLMQSSRSSQWSSSLGIPVINNNIARPFNCLTRKQIEKLNSLLEVPYISDLSNKNFRFERNYCRAKIIPLIEDKYPKMLKHYVHRSNEMARTLGLLRSKGSDRSRESYKIIKNHPDITLVIDLKLEGNFTYIRSELIEIIKLHSSKKKGKISTQLNSLLSAVSTGAKGP